MQLRLLWSPIFAIIGGGSAGNESTRDARDTGDGGSSLCREDPLEEKMATHPSILAWRILWTEEPGGLQSMGFQRVRHDRSD